jgi:hypothetical protein
MHFVLAVKNAMLCRRVLPCWSLQRNLRVAVEIIDAHNAPITTFFSKQERPELWPINPATRNEQDHRRIDLSSLELAPILGKKNPSMQNAPRLDKDLTGLRADVAHFFSGVELGVKQRKTERPLKFRPFYRFIKLRIIYIYSYPYISYNRQSYC